MIKKIVNGKIVEMTTEEIKELTDFIPDEVKETVEDRLEKLEKLFSKIADLLGVR